MTQRDDEAWGEDLPRGLREALEAAKGDLPSAHEVSALEASVLGALARVGGGGGGGGGAAAAKASGAAWVQAGSVAVLAIAGVLAWNAMESDEVRVPEASGTVREVVDVLEDAGVPVSDAGEADAAVAAAELEEAPEPTRVPRIEPRTPALEAVIEAVPPSVDPPEETPEAPAEEPIDEMALLRAAQRALRSDPSEALALTTRMADVPSPEWAEERERVAIEALDRLGRDAEARARFERFAVAYPRSAYRARLEEVLETP